jgi:hypothetical protein
VKKKNKISQSIMDSPEKKKPLLNEERMGE